MDTEGEREWWEELGDWDQHKHTVDTMYETGNLKKQITTEDLLQSPENSTWRPVVTEMGRKSKSYCTADSLCCTIEANIVTHWNTVIQLYSNDN